MRRAEIEMERDMKMRKIRQDIAEKRTKKKTKFASLSLHPFSQSVSELGNRPVQIRKLRSKTKTIKTTKTGKLISPKRGKGKKKKRQKRQNKKNAGRRSGEMGLTASMLGGSFGLHGGVGGGGAFSNSVEEALAEGEAWRQRLHAQEHQRREDEEDLGDLSEYDDAELQLSPLERERNLMARVAPQLDRVLGYDVGEGPQ
jgi:hypothetical protein